MSSHRFTLRKILLLVGGVVILILPIPHDEPTHSQALYDKNGQLMSAIVSKDEQWCIPLEGDIPGPLRQCIVLYEDEYFYIHPGINPISIIKAFFDNINHNKIVRGASTIPMQVMRMLHRHSKRNMWNKTYEAIAACKLKLFKSDKAIVNKWAQIAPFGGNVIGAPAAAYRYFGRDLTLLSWSEYALLAVLPNAPSTVNINNNRIKLKSKRDFLLQKLASKGIITQDDALIYMDEPLPSSTHTIPTEGYHLLNYLGQSSPHTFIHNSTIIPSIQSTLTQSIQSYSSIYQQNGINNAAGLVIDLQNNHLTAYMGNTTSKKNALRYVDVIQRPRSYGSLLKPILYAYALDKGFILPQEMIWDIPTNFGDFIPKNFDHKYRGAVHADEMVINSLNVPAVNLLQQVDHRAFYDFLQRAYPQRYLDHGADHYGLSLILGGGESSLWDIAIMYKSIAQSYFDYKLPARSKLFPHLPQPDPHTKPLSIFAMHHAIEAMSNVNRPREESFFQHRGLEYKIAWKTGTSYGHRDAWAIGFNDKYLVAIWVGNESGEGRNNLTGIIKAAPIMFDVFNQLPKSPWNEPDAIMNSKNVITQCEDSGMLAGNLCKRKIKTFTPMISHQWQTCKYHKIYHLNHAGHWIDPLCSEPVSRMDTLFQLPSFVAAYYGASNIDYVIPNKSDNCVTEGNDIVITYPFDGLKIFLPRDNDHTQQMLVATSHAPKTKLLYWYLNDQLLGTTTNVHSMSVKSQPGNHHLRIYDHSGASHEVEFSIIEAEE